VQPDGGRVRQVDTRRNESFHAREGEEPMDWKSPSRNRRRPSLLGSRAVALKRRALMLAGPVALVVMLVAWLRFPQVQADAPRVEVNASVHVDEWEHALARRGGPMLVFMASVDGRGVQIPCSQAEKVCAFVRRHRHEAVQAVLFRYAGGFRLASASHQGVPIISAAQQAEDHGHPFSGVYFVLVLFAGAVASTIGFFQERGSVHRTPRSEG
jgi:hypothetical protein